jgi:hypothetical protein
MKQKSKSSKKRTTKRAAKRSGANRSSRKPTTRKASASPPRHKPTPGLYGWITHTELASNNPIATRNWCAKVLGWTFMQPFPAHEGGEYHLFTYSEKGGGGIRMTKPAETPGSSFTVHVADAGEAYDKAVREGAEPITPPMRIMEGVTIAVVRAPGGVPVGFSGP